MSLHSDPLSRIQDWYSRSCDGEWEHFFGIKIESIDNPGWEFEVDTTETNTKIQDIERYLVERTENDWLSIGVKNGVFTAACGPKNLGEIIDIFLELCSKNEKQLT